MRAAWICGWSLAVACTNPDGGRLLALDEPQILARDFARDWIKLNTVPLLQWEVVRTIARSSWGYVALVQRNLTDSGVLAGAQNRLYLSSDGLHWEELPPVVFDNRSTGLHDLLCVDSGCFAVGHATLGGEGVLVFSRDMASWERRRIGVPIATRIRLVNGRLFVLGTRLSWSDNGRTWHDAGTMEASLNDVVFGAGIYVAVGNTRFLRSTDGETWQPVAVDCAQVGCVTAPNGSRTSVPTKRVFYANGTFYADRLISTDGLAWSANTGKIATQFRDGLFLSVSNETVMAWPPDQSEALQVGLEATDTSVDCTSAKCVILERSLVAIPPT